MLGRGVHVSRQFLPRREFLGEVKLSWTRAALLTSEQLVESKSLYARLFSEAAAFLQETWERLIQKLDAVREGDKFRKQWSIREEFLPTIPAPDLSRFVRITADSSAVSSASPPCSGAIVNTAFALEELERLNKG